MREHPPGPCTLFLGRSETTGRHGGYSSDGRAPGCGPGCRGFKSRYSPSSGKPLTCGYAGQGLFRSPGRSDHGQARPDFRPAVRPMATIRIGAAGTDGTAGSQARRLRGGRGGAWGRKIAGDSGAAGSRAARSTATGGPRSGLRSRRFPWGATSALTVRTAQLPVWVRRRLGNRLHPATGLLRAYFLREPGWRSHQQRHGREDIDVMWVPEMRYPAPSPSTIFPPSCLSWRSRRDAAEHERAAGYRRRDRRSRGPCAHGPPSSERGTALLQFPAGEIEPGEESEDAAVRETQEETGLTVAAVRLLGERVHQS